MLLYKTKLFSLRARYATRNRLRSQDQEPECSETIEPYLFIWEGKVAIGRRIKDNMFVIGA